MSEPRAVHEVPLFAARGRSREAARPKIDVAADTGAAL
jgi:hypothetical protein